MNSNQQTNNSGGLVRHTAASAVRTRCKKITKFFITVTDIEVYDSVRSDFVELFSDVNAYCCVIEKHKHLNSHHLHCYTEQLRSRLNVVQATIPFWLSEDVILQKVPSLLPPVSLLSSDEEASSSNLPPTPEEDNFSRFIRNTENNY